MNAPLPRLTLADAAPDERLRVCFPFSGDSIGGSHISVRGLIGHLDPALYRPLVVTEVPGGMIANFFAGHEQMDDPAAHGLFVPGEAFTLRKFGRTLGGVLTRTRFLRRNRVDIVHVNDGRSSANWALPARLAGAKLIWHHRGDPGALGLRLLAPALAHRVLAVSSFALPPAGIWSARSRASVIHSPFDTTLEVDRTRAREALIRELGVSPDTLLLGYFGAFVPRKRPLLFVDMIARLTDGMGGPVMGLMFGEARVPAMDIALRRRIVEKGVEDRVKLMGYRTPGPFWIAACDRLVVPAVGEPFGRTLVEAMLVGTPIVAARSGGNVEALEGGIGLLVEPDDAGALARACADPGDVRAMALRARADARARFSEAAHCAKVCAIYEALRP
ncbi:glycosyl transferase [Sphingobium sp. 22B]|uniref:glycosyltransferase n=1 Tax=unclassified Sphingobium TaxID=2611147 RepID=UPI0007860E07|nr:MULTISPECIES: glycosyltransferase [unclassified Sphingobium]KXU32787.1 glycosyl transferase [Sphingobium sp. AM]KYC32868.1 glycosyl transferase [Sphingobium sp. 22B]OAP32145.1 glycosyl transferase [Sphingobium sp. 20006FA]